MANGPRTFRAYVWDTSATAEIGDQGVYESEKREVRIVRSKVRRPVQGGAAARAYYRGALGVRTGAPGAGVPSRGEGQLLVCAGEPAPVHTATDAIKAPNALLTGTGGATAARYGLVNRS